MEAVKQLSRHIFRCPREKDDEDLFPNVEFYHGNATPVEFLNNYLINPLNNMSIFDPSSFVIRNNLMLFGKKGSGKKTLIDGYSGQFEKTIGFSIMDFNVAGFVEWVDIIVEKLKNIDDPENEFKSISTLIVIENIDIIPHCQNQIPENKLRMLFHYVKLVGQSGYPIFIVSTCAESPGRQAREVSLMIDYECYVPPPDSEQRLALFKFFVESWKSAITNKPELQRITVNLEPEDYNLLVSLSGQCAPGDIWNFCQDMFHAICKPNEEASLDTNLIQTLIKTTESGPCILHYDPKDDLDSFDVYTGKKDQRMNIKETTKLSAQQALEERSIRLEQDESQTWPPPMNKKSNLPWIVDENSDEDRDNKRKGTPDLDDIDSSDIEIEKKTDTKRHRS